MKTRVSILVPLHNEGRIIKAALDNLAQIIDDNTEVIAGLDACTDSTGSIVRQYSFVRIAEFPLRRGKHQVINELSRIAGGQIIIVHDADWIVSVDGGIETIRRAFEDSRVGALAVPIGGMPRGRKALAGATIAFKGENIVAHYLTEYQFRRCVLWEEGYCYVDDAARCHPFMVTIYRASAVGEISTTADDMERALIVRKKGLRIRVMGPRGPRVYFEARDVDKSLRIIFLRNIRSYISITEVGKLYSFSSPAGYYLSATGYVFYKTLIHHPLDIMAVLLWYLVTVCAFLAAKAVGLKRFDARQLWHYRADRGQKDGA